MKSSRDILLLGLFSAVSVAAYLVASARTYGIGFPLDDAWIHQVYARNLAERGEWAFAPGEPSAGSTAPLWPALLAMGPLLGLGPYAVTFLLGWLALWALAWVGYTTFLQMLPERRGWAMAAGTLLALEWHMVWSAASGMETLLFALLATAVMILLLKMEQARPNVSFWRWLGLGLLVGLSMWIRPEGITLLGPVALGALLFEKAWAQRGQSLALALAGFAVLFVPYLMFNVNLSGEWWPNTFFAKQAEYAIHRRLPLALRLGQQYALPLIGAGALLLPGFVYRIVRAFKTQAWGVLLAAAWALGHLTLYALRLPVTYQHGRYAMPAMPILFLLGAAGLAEWLRPNAPALWPRVLGRAWLASTAAVLFAFWTIGAGAYARDVAFIESEMVAASHWIADNTDPGDLVAAHDIGALGYFGGRPILDLAGLVSPEVIPFIRDEGRLAAYLDERGAAYLMTFPGWYPDLAARGELVFQTAGQVSPALGGENMAVFAWHLP